MSTLERLNGLPSGLTRLENPLILVDKRLSLSITGEEFTLEGGNPEPKVGVFDLGGERR